VGGRVVYQALIEGERILSYSKAQFAWLETRAANLTSQFGENGILAAVFERIGTANKYCCECGAGDGVFMSNTWPLLTREGWRGLQIEADRDEFLKLARLYAENPAVTCYNHRVTPDGFTCLDSLLDAAHAPRDLDLLVIDVDGQDYHLFNSLLRFRPRVVVVEYDPNAPGLPDVIPPIGGPGQANLQAILRLGVGKLYYPVCATWCNVIFVQQELVHLLADAPALEHPVDDPYTASVRTATKAPMEWPAEDAPRSLKVVAVTSIPQLGHNVNYGCQIEALTPFGIPIRQCYGAYWHQTLSEGIDAVLAQGVDYVLTLDYDVLFTAKHVADLMALAMDHPDADVIVPCLCKREGNGLCAHTKEQDPTKGGVNLNDELIPIQLGHFGLTLFKASAFARLSRPWFLPVPDPTGGWGEGHIDADMNFWLNCEASGLTVMLARHVRVGHIEYMATIPNAADPRQTDYVHVGEWRKWAVKENEAVRERLEQARRAMPELFPKDIEAIAKAAFEAHTKERWDAAHPETQAQWRDRVPDAIAGRGSRDGVPGLEQAIIDAWRARTAPPAVEAPAPVPGIAPDPPVFTPEPVPAPTSKPSKPKTR